MVSNKITVRNRVTKEAMHYHAESYDSVLDHVRRNMAHELAHTLLENVEIRRLHDPHPYSWDVTDYTEYEMSCFVIDAEEYSKLLKAERDLEALRGIINDQ